MRRHNFLFILAIFLCVSGYSQSDTLQILPDNPTINDSIKLLSYKCNFDQTVFEIGDDTITFIVNTDSRIMAPCILAWDTLNIGTLAQGLWVVQYYYVDQAMTGPDSIVFETTRDIIVSGSTDIPGPAGIPEWTIHPIPMSRILVIDGIDNEACSETARVIIIDTQGRIIKKLDLSDTETTIDVSDFNGGCYHLIISRNDGQVILREMIVKY